MHLVRERGARLGMGAGLRFGSHTGAVEHLGSRRFSAGVLLLLAAFAILLLAAMAAPSSAHALTWSNHNPAIGSTVTRRQHADPCVGQRRRADPNLVDLEPQAVDQRHRLLRVRLARPADAATGQDAVPPTASCPTGSRRSPSQVTDVNGTVYNTSWNYTVAAPPTVEHRTCPRVGSTVAVPRPQIGRHGRRQHARET